MTSNKMTQVEEEMSDENSTELNDNDVMKRFNQELESVSVALIDNFKDWSYSNPTRPHL